MFISFDQEAAKSMPKTLKRTSAISKANTNRSTQGSIQRLEPTLAASVSPLSTTAAPANLEPLLAPVGTTVATATVELTTATSTEPFNFDDEKIRQMKMDALESILGDYYLESLTDEELEFFLSMVPYDESGCVVIMSPLPYEFFSGALQDYREGFVNEDEFARAKREKLQLGEYKDISAFPYFYYYDSSGKLVSEYSSLFTGTDQEILDAIALYNISLMTDADYASRGDTFTAFGKSWFNVPNYTKMMEADILNLSNAY